MKRLAFVVLLAMITLVGCTAGQAGTATPAGKAQDASATMGKKVSVGGGAYTDVNSDELKAMLDKKDFAFINVHIPYEGEIPNTDAFIPYNEIEKNLDKLPKDKNAKIVLYCRSGRMSAIAAESLVKQGYTNVFNHTGGMVDWQAKGYPLLDKPR